MCSADTSPVASIFGIYLTELTQWLGRRRPWLPLLDVRLWLWGHLLLNSRAHWPTDLAILRRTSGILLGGAMKQQASTVAQF